MDENAERVHKLADELQAMYGDTSSPPYESTPNFQAEADESPGRLSDLQGNFLVRLNNYIRFISVVS